MPNRPKYIPRPDDNHKIVVDFLRDACGGFQAFKSGSTNGYSAFLRGHYVWAIDTSKVGGLLTDWLVGSGAEIVMCEVKMPEAYAKADHALTDGEKITATLTEVCIVSTDADVAGMFYKLIGED
jgi:hypothetical protein